MKKIILLILILFTTYTYAQIGIGTTNPNAAIEVSSSNDGFLLPRVALTNKTDAKILTPTISEIVYNTAISGEAPNDVRPGFYFWTGTSWMELDNASGTKNWRTTGNAGTDAGIEFVGTTDNVDFNFRRNNIKSGALGTANTAFGSSSLLVNTAVGTTAFGASALATNTNATGNMAFGYGALQDNKVADATTNFGNIDNTAFGLEALRYNNVNMFDFPPGSSSPRAKGNTAVGSRALRANTRGFSNTAAGPNALTSNTNGTFNTAIGPETLASNNHSSNTALGPEVLRYSTSGSNTAFGKWSAQSNTIHAAASTAAGSNSMLRTTDGSENTVFGYNVLLENVLGAQHTVAGALAMENINGSNRSTFIGYKAWWTPPSTSRLWSSNSVGIGSQCLSNLTSPSFNIGIGKGVEIPNTNNQVCIGNSEIQYAYIQVPWSPTSDRRWKSNIKSSKLGLDFIKELNPVSYIRKNDESKKTEYGFIAQELEQVLDKFKASDNGIILKVDNDMLGVRYNDLLAPMVKAIQQQQTIIKKLITRIKELEENRIKK
jgi:hypothetical protein